MCRRPGGGSLGAALHASARLWPGVPTPRGRRGQKGAEVPDEPVQRPDLDPVHEAIERLEWADGKQEDTPHTRWRDITRRTALTGGAAGVAAFILNACGGGKKTTSTGTTAAAAAGTPAAGVFGSQPKLKFVLVNHVTTNPFFVPTKYGAEDACKLLGCTYQWTGSESSNVNEMVNAFNSAISAKADGIAVCLVDLKAFNGPTDKALDAEDPGRRLQRRRGRQRPARLHRPGPVRLRARRWASASSTSSASGDVALFIATPGSLNIQPRIDGAIDTIKKSGKGDHAARDRHRRRAPEGALDDRRLLARPQEHEGHVRRRRRQHRRASRR